MVGKNRIGELERLGPGGKDVLVLGVDAPGFESLSADHRILCYYLYRAAVSGNAIAFKQSHRHAYEIKTLLESIHLHSDGLDDDLAAAIHGYLKRIWIHHGQYDHYTHTKFVPDDFDAADLTAAAGHALARGAEIPLNPNETIEEVISRLEASIFDPHFEPIQTNQSDCDDIVVTSAVNYWDPDVTAAEIEALPPHVRDKINVRFAKNNGEVAAEVYRIGGVYDSEIRTICHFLEKALPYAIDDNQRASIEALLRFYDNGDEEEFRRHCVHWLQTDGDVDYLNGFVEVYLDPRGAIGQFEGNVSFRAGAGLVDKLADNAVYFEKRMPWPDKYKRTEINRPVATIVNVLVETGDAGPVSPAAYNLPNYNDIRRDHGSKNVILHNIENSWSEELLHQSVNAFFLPRYRENVIQYWRSVVRPLEVYMHEIIGHGSGQPDESLTVDPRMLLGRVYSALEECRADLVALYHIADPKLIELGAFTLREQRAIVETMYITYLQGWMSRFDRVPGVEVREAHNRGSHAILMYLLDRVDSGVQVIEVEGDYFVEVDDLESTRDGVAGLLRKIQKIKSTGDREGAERLFDEYGTRLEPAWKKNILERKDRLNLPKTKAFVFPRLRPVVRDGEVVDVERVHDEDLTAQQLRFSRLEHSTRVEDDL